jgi:hypothetical protein
VKLPIDWATNENYAAGPDTGTPTRVDPGTPGDGFIAGTAAAPQHVNFLLNAQASASRRALTVDMLRLTRVDLEGTAITDVGDVMAAVSLGEGYPVLACKTAQAFGISDCERFTVEGVPASITSFVGVAAFDPATGRVLVGGTGGNRCSYSDDGGTNWSAGGDITFTPLSLVWNSTHSVFMAARANATMKYGANGTSWTSGTVSNTPNGALAVFANGNTLANGNGAAIGFSLSTDGGATWADTSGVPATAMGSAFSGVGWIAGNEGEKVYHVGKNAAGDKFQVSSTLDGTTWVSEKVFTLPHGVAADPKILMCQNTGLIVALMPFVVGVGSQPVCMVSASVDGSSWTDPMYVRLKNSAIDVDAFALAGGRLLFTIDDMLFASAGIGYA